MKLIYERSFLKDVKALRDASAKRIDEILTKLADMQTIEALVSVKKLKGHKSAYRIRIGDYRIGVFLEVENITLVRVLHEVKYTNISHSNYERDCVKINQPISLDSNEH